MDRLADAIHALNYLDMRAFAEAVYDALPDEYDPREISVELVADLLANWAVEWRDRDPVAKPAD